MVSAQAPNTRAARVVEQIGREADARSQVMELARELTDSYGPRLTGSPHMKAAGNFVIRRLREWGVTDARFERWGPFGPGWTTDRFVALAVAPAPFPLQAYPKAWTPGTSGEVVAEAVLAAIDSEDDFATHRGTLRGKYVLTPPLAGASSPAQLEFARRRMAFFIEEGALALLEPGGPAGSVVVTDGRLRDDAAFGGNGFYPWPDPVAAQVVLATEHYNRLARMIEAGSPVTLELNVVNAYHPAEPDSFNIVAELPGTDRRSEIVLVGAHFDSWHAATGALDNAAGSAVVLDAMRILSALKLEMRRTVRLVLWTGSEQGLLGSRFYVAEHFADPAVMQPKPAHAPVAGYINLDGGTGAIRGVHVQGNEGARAALQGWLESVKEFGVTTRGSGNDLGQRSCGVRCGRPSGARPHSGRQRLRHDSPFERGHVRATAAPGPGPQRRRGRVIGLLPGNPRRPAAAQAPPEARSEGGWTVAPGQALEKVTSYNGEVTKKARLVNSRIVTCNFRLTRLLRRCRPALQRSPSA